jgi:hypothetical protein
MEFEPRNEFEPGTEFQPESEFEQSLRQAMERRPAPPGLKQRLMAKRSRQQGERLASATMMWQRLAAATVLAAAVAGGVAWRNHEQRAAEQARGEEARREVFIALRITSRALNQMNVLLAARGRDGQE